MTLRLSRIMMALVVGTASLVSALSVESASAVSQTCAWTGTAGDKKFSTAANWSGCGGGAPLAGDIVTIDTDVFADTAAATGLNNDLAVALGGITVTKGTTNTNGVYDVTIDTLSLADGATIATPKNSANELASLVVNTGSARGIVTSTGSITVPGQVYAEYNVTGTATLNSGAYITDESHFGTLKIGDGAMVTLSLATPSLTVDLPYALHFVSSTSTMRFIPYCVAATCDPVTITETHPITLAGNTQLTIDKDVVLNVTGTVTGGHAHQDFTECWRTQRCRRDRHDSRQDDGMYQQPAHSDSFGCRKRDLCDRFWLSEELNDRVYRRFAQGYQYC